MADHDLDALQAARRKLLRAGAGAAALDSFPVPHKSQRMRQGAFDWKRFKGERSRFSWSRARAATC